MHFVRTAILLAPLLSIAASAPALDLKREQSAASVGADYMWAHKAKRTWAPAAVAKYNPQGTRGKRDNPSGTGSGSESGSGSGSTPDPTTQPQPDPTTQPTSDNSAATQYYLKASGVAPDNSTATLECGGSGTIAALGAFTADSNVDWDSHKLEVGFSANVNGSSLGGGYTMKDGVISVGAGIGYGNQEGTSFSLDVSTNGTVVASVFGDNLKCVVEGNKATCSN
ncbi:hypothetical protein CF319_g4195 [Tilletia indica]|uniref:Uncharacterized protein n=1 Tax=Tilletia indica TaxID=43049 RepID=A0A177TCI1_9BASI|nr:hypothetical protein CF319_g4195 [Tilletia indica]KAE8229480.1 hypothetical protein CF326_g5550 [Tilletia indica]KAE8255841.1 hypothetical protein A4X13_0g2895 [Tilletia indica]